MFLVTPYNLSESIIQWNKAEPAAYSFPKQLGSIKYGIFSIKTISYENVVYPVTTMSSLNESKIWVMLFLITFSSKSNFSYKNCWEIHVICESLTNTLYSSMVLLTKMTLL